MSAKNLNPEGYLATHDLKERGWTPALMTRFLGEHDDTRPNGIKMGRRRLPPVKLYREERVLEIERQDAFLAAQAKAADARERAERQRTERRERRARLLESVAQQFVPTIHPEPLRKGAKRKARAPYLPQVEEALSVLAPQIEKLTEAEENELRRLLLAQLDQALAEVYDWYAKPKPKPNATAEAQPSDWRTWDWDE